MNSCGAWSQLTGTRVGLLSGEVRTALPRLFKTPIPVPPIEVAVFFDAGLAWDSRSHLVLKRSPLQQQDMAHYRAPLMSWGLSLRSNMLGYFILRADFAKPLTREAQGFYWILSFGPTF